MLRANLRFCEWDPTLWSSIIRCKYGCGQNIVLSINPNRSGSNFWKGLHSTWDLFCANNFCKLSNVYSENKNDKVIWKGYPNGTFSLKLAYNVFYNLEMVSEVRWFKLVHH